MDSLALRVIRERMEDQELALRGGLSIGRDPGHDIIIDEPAVRPAHAVVLGAPGQWRIECVDDAVLMFMDGFPVRRLNLTPGVMFVVGSALIQCLGDESPPPKARRAKVAHGEVDCCPRCALNFAALPRHARFCPRCGLDRESNPSAAARPGYEAQITDWNRILAEPMRCPLAEDPGGAHSLILSGYAAAMANLGLRYEAGLGTQKNPDEAIRCYIKSARLGNQQARQRLASRGIQ